MFALGTDKQMYKMTWDGSTWSGWSSIGGQFTSVRPKGDPLGAYRMVGKDSAKARWLKGVAEDKAATLIPPGVFDAWWNATLATDPVGSKLDPPMLRAPNGVVEESINYWLAGKPYYDPGKITVPTLLIHAEWDADLPAWPELAAEAERAETIMLAADRREVRRAARC